MNDSALFASFTAMAMVFGSVVGIQLIHPWLTQHIHYFLSFAAGVLIAMAFLHILPEAMPLNPQAPFFFLLGFLILYVMHRLWHQPHHHDHSQQSIDDHPHPPFKNKPPDDPELEARHTTWIALMGLGFHSLIDGMIYTVSYQVSFLTGLMTTFGLILHKCPEALLTYVFMLRGHYTRKQALWVAFAVTGVTTPMGTLLTLPLVSQLKTSALGALLAIAGGMLAYVGSGHLLPASEHENNPTNTIALFCGIGLTLLMIWAEHLFLGHTHA